MARLIGRIVRAGQITSNSDEGTRFNGIVIEVNEDQLREFPENLLFKEVEIRIGIGTQIASSSEEVSREPAKKKCIGEEMAERNWPIPGRFISKSFSDTWTSWINCRMKMKQPKDPIEMFNKQLEWLAGFDESVAIEVMEASIRNGWIGLHEPKVGAYGNRRAASGNGSNGGELVGDGSWESSRGEFLDRKRAGQSSAIDPFGKDSNEVGGTKYP